MALDYILVGKGFALAVGGAFAGGLVVAVAAASPVGGWHSHQNWSRRKTRRGSSQRQPALLGVPLLTSLTAPGPVERAQESGAAGGRGNGRGLAGCPWASPRVSHLSNGEHLGLFPLSREGLRDNWTFYSFYPVTHTV